MNDISISRGARLALAVAIVLFLTLLFLILFFIIGQPFGALSDASIGLGAILSAVLGWALYPMHHARASHASRIGFGATAVGAVLAVLGSTSVISRITGFVLADWFTATGYALIGVWLLLFCDAARRAEWLPRGLTNFGLAAAASLLFGFLAVPGILSKSDSIDALQAWYLAASQISYLGMFFLFPAWCIRLWRYLSSQARAVVTVG